MATKEFTYINWRTHENTWHVVRAHERMPNSVNCVCTVHDHAAVLEQRDLVDIASATITCLWCVVGMDTCNWWSDP